MTTQKMLEFDVKVNNIASNTISVVFSFQTNDFL